MNKFDTKQIKGTTKDQQITTNLKTNREHSIDLQKQIKE